MFGKRIMDDFFDYLKNGLIEVDGKKEYKMELPFPRPSGDSVVVKIWKHGSDYLISDDGFITEYLFVHGIDLWELEQEEMKEAFWRSKQRYGILERYKPDIVLKTTEDKINTKLRSMMNVVNELCHLTLVRR